MAQFSRGKQGVRGACLLLLILAGIVIVYALPGALADGGLLDAVWCMVCVVVAAGSGAVVVCLQPDVAPLAQEVTQQLGAKRTVGMWACLVAIVVAGVSAMHLTVELFRRPALADGLWLIFCLCAVLVAGRVGTRIGPVEARKATGTVSS